MKIFCLIIALFLTACTSSKYTGDNYIKEYKSKNYNSRVRYVVMHYTALDFQGSLHALTKGAVSSHYLIDKNGDIYQLVDENKRAWHAGVSNWQGYQSLNGISIGIEIVNPGYIEDEYGNKTWIAYTEQQAKSILNLAQDITIRHKLPIDRIVGHSDIAFMRKSDPGPLFPWKSLADAGLINWYGDLQAESYESKFSKNLPETKWFADNLKHIGYDVKCSMEGCTKEETLMLDKALYAFQMKYCGLHMCAGYDAKTAAIIASLTENLKKLN